MDRYWPQTGGGRASIQSDFCASRYGGEEFILILRSRTTLDLGVFAEGIRQCVAELRPADVTTLEKITVSIGVAQFSPGKSFAKTNSRADSALYLAKESGRNRVIFAGSTKEDEKNPYSTRANVTATDLELQK